jgi:hypothetical protein
MIGYRFYFLGQDGKIKSAEDIECPTDTDALAEAERRLAAGTYPAIEVWERARRVGLVGRLIDDAEVSRESAAPFNPSPSHQTGL